MVFSLFFGKGSAREIPFFHRKNNKEEQAGVSVSAILYSILKIKSLMIHFYTWQKYKNEKWATR